MRKLCAFTAEFAEKNPKAVKAVLKALNEASLWLDTMSNRPEACDIVSKATYINCAPKQILGRLQGHYDYGDGRKIERTVTGNSIHYVLDENGEVVNALPGLYSPNRFYQFLTIFVTIYFLPAVIHVCGLLFLDIYNLLFISSFLEIYSENVFM